jgi:hypothetical protein
LPDRRVSTVFRSISPPTSSARVRPLRGLWRAGKKSLNAGRGGLKGRWRFTPTAPHAAQQSAWLSGQLSCGCGKHRKGAKGSFGPTVRRHPSTQHDGRRTSCPRHDRSLATGTVHLPPDERDREAASTLGSSRAGARVSAVESPSTASPSPRVAAASAIPCSFVFVLSPAPYGSGEHGWKSS